MKRLGVILALLVAMAMPLRAQLVVTNSIIGTCDASSYDTSGTVNGAGYAGIFLGYFKAALNSVYPTWPHMLVSLSHSGATIQLMVTNDIPAAGPAVWCLATSNGVVPRNFVLPNDNGNYTSNTWYPLGLNYSQYPGLCYNGTDYTNEGFTFSIDHFFMGGLLSSGRLTDLNSVGRKQASTNLMGVLGKNIIDILDDVNTNGFSTAANFTTDFTGNEFFFQGNHPTQKNALQDFISLWRQLGLVTNVYSITIDASALTVPSSNSIACTGISISNGAVIGTFKCDRFIAMGDIVPGRSNNISGTLWTNCPNFGNVFTATWAFTNLTPAITYDLYWDGVIVATATGSQWLSGVNMATNQVAANPLNVQWTNILNSVRKEYGADYFGTQTHSAGGNGPLGPDLINYTSLVGTKWPAKHGPSLVNDATIQTDVNGLWTYALSTHTNALQTSHSFTLAPHGGLNTPKLTIGTLHLGG